MTFRKILFWAHLGAGIISGLSIGIMCFTGTVLAFEKELVAWAERDARQVSAPAPGTPRLRLEELQRRLRDAQPEARPMNIILQNDPRAAVVFSSGRGGGFYLNPYTGEIRQPKSGAMGEFMRVMVAWHRYLGFNGELSRPRGKFVNGVCNLAFCVLAITGLYLWMPRAWSWRAIRPVIWFRQNTSAKTRDFNWHNTIGFWSAPVLIVLTLTAVPISFRWGGNVILILTGTEAPPASGSGAARAPGGPPLEVPIPTPPATPLGADALVAVVQKDIPTWTTITMRTNNGGGTPATTRQAASFTVRESSSWPRTATTTLMLNPFNGEILRRSGYAEMNAAQQVRSWTRFLHTGEAVGWIGQLVAGVACLGGVFLVYTGFALSWRRFFGQRPPANSAEKARAPEEEIVTAGRLG